MKRTIIFSALMLVAFMAHAEDYNYMIFAQSSGNRTAVEAEGLIITFADGYLVATSASGDATRISLTDMSSMWFSESATTGITALRNGNATVEANGNSLIAQADKGTRYTVATLSGMVISQGAITDATGEAIAQGLNRGLYVVRIGEKSIKLQVK